MKFDRFFYGIDLAMRFVRLSGGRKVHMRAAEARAAAEEDVEDGGDAGEGRRPEARGAGKGGKSA